MEKAEIEVAKKFWKKENKIVVYPVIIQNPRISKISIKTAFKIKNGFKWNQSFYGDLRNRPMNNWEDVKDYYEKELESISNIITPLFYNDIEKANKAWKKENTSNLIIKGIDDLLNNEEVDIMDKLLRGNELKNKTKIIDINKWDNKHPRAKIKHWLPIWDAWKFSYEIFTKLYRNKQLVEL